MTASEINKVFERLGMPDRLKPGEPMTPRHFFTMARAISEKLAEIRGEKKPDPKQYHTIKLDAQGVGPMATPQKLSEMLDRINGEATGRYRLHLVPDETTKTAPRDNPGEMG